jgi:hypothetical protein
MIVTLESRNKGLLVEELQSLVLHAIATAVQGVKKVRLLAC